jgi:hypothetical protein
VGNETETEFLGSFFCCLATGRLISQGGTYVYNFLSSSPRFDNRNDNDGMISVFFFFFFFFSALTKGRECCRNYNVEMKFG